MSATTTREDPFIKLFLSAYESYSWADAKLEKPDALDRTNPAVDQLATRSADGRKLAIEHTIIEPFVGDKEDFAFFEAAFLGIERDNSLPVPGCRIQVFVPVGVLRNQPRAARDAIVESVHQWIKANRLVLSYGASQHQCAIGGSLGNLPSQIILNLKVTPLQRGSDLQPGSFHVRRQQVEDDLDKVIEKALRNKVQKLANTTADKRILMLERQHMNHIPKRILAEIEKQRSAFPALAAVDEIWILENIGFGTTSGSTSPYFARYENGTEVSSYDFNNGRLWMKVEDVMRTGR